MMQLKDYPERGSGATSDEQIFETITRVNLSSQYLRFAMLVKGSRRYESTSPIHRDLINNDRHSNFRHSINRGIARLVNLRTIVFFGEQLEFSNTRQCPLG